jgi:hypothetical protein
MNIFNNLIYKYTAENILIHLDEYELYEFLFINPIYYNSIYKLDISYLNNCYQQYYIKYLYKFINLIVISVNLLRIKILKN